MGDAFLWGTSTSGHQIEGDNRHSDWWAFERARGLTPSGRACDFRARFGDDLDIAKALGTNAFRFSLEWCRVEPRPGHRDDEAARWYDAVVDGCLARGLEPVMTLSHFTLPLWCRREGRVGWRDPAVVAAFVRHVRWVASRYGDRVRWFVTINEPNVLAAASHLAGVFPPGGLLRVGRARACHAGLVQAHVGAYRALHEVIGARWPGGRRLWVGPAQHVVRWRPSWADVGGVIQRAGARFNWAFTDATCGPDATPSGPTADFVGINYFMAQPAEPLSLARFMGWAPRRWGAEWSDLGWPIDPEGLTEALGEAWRRYRLPVMVTENGVADVSDRVRPAYLRAHLEALDRAQRAGVDVRGYCHWSLIDNLEWHEGFAPRFGLVQVDYATLRRTVRPSGRLYRRLIEDRSPMKTGSR